MLIESLLQQRINSMIKYIERPLLWAVRVFPQPSLSFPSGGHMNTWPWWQTQRLRLGSTTWTSTHQGWPGYSHLGTPDLPTAETNTDPKIWLHSLGWLASSMMSGWLHWTTSSMERTILCPCWSRYLFWNEFAFPTHLTYARVTIRGLTERLINCRGFPASSASDQGSHSISKC